jgi:NAD-dependent deacetylase
VGKADVRVVVLTGAGVSAESGVPTFRDADGLWEGHDVMSVASPEGFEADPVLVHRFYDLRREALGRVGPNPAHRALARLEAELGDDLTVVTQNVDDLHERAGSTRVLHMHGELRAAVCRFCNSRHRWDGTLGDEPDCPTCGIPELRPDVVWFGEVPYHMDEVAEALDKADVFAAVGTSGQVYPAAAFVHWARAAGAHTVELNLEVTTLSNDFHVARQGPAGTLVPAWVEELLG